MKSLTAICLIALLCGCAPSKGYISSYPIAAGTWQFSLIEANGDIFGTPTITLFQNGESLIHDKYSPLWKKDVWWKGTVSRDGQIYLFIDGHLGSGSMRGSIQGNRMSGNWGIQGKKGSWLAEKEEADRDRDAHH